VKGNKVLKFSEIGEFGFIDSIKTLCDTSRKGVIKGIGDDCALFRPYSGRVLLLTTDMLVEDTHFLRDTVPFYQLGWKVVAVNLSDIAAMGGRPLMSLISLAIPVQMNVEAIQELYRGMKDICTRYEVDIVGGDTVASPNRLALNVSVIGDAKEDEVLYRSGAGTGDKIYLTGNLGDSSAGLKILKNEISPPVSIGSYFIKAHSEPIPLIETGSIIAASGLASAMIDLSDGLLSDLGHICRESGVGALLYAEKIPLSSELRLLASHANFNPLDLALSGGEDYQLLFTVPETKAQEIKNVFKEYRLSPPSLIGEIRQERGIRMVNDDGSVLELDAKGFNHFS
jgi:thiamine-monophosphate kinase